MGMKLYKRYKAIAYLPNPYCLLQYLLMEPYEIKNTLFLIHGEFPISVASRLPESDILRDSSGFEFISLLKIYWLIVMNRNIPVFLGGDLMFTNSFLAFSKNPIYLEDGTVSYKVENKARKVMCKRKRFLARLFMGNLYPELGLANNVHKIYLTGILPIPEIIANKVEVINLKQLWYQKTIEQQDEICHVFLPTDFNMNLIRKYDVLLLTQPFSEYSDGRFSEQEKIDVYRKLISKYDESKVVIKTQPFEITDYSKYFPKAHILNICCPIELLFFMGLSAKITISVSSTAIFGMDDSCKKIITGYDVTPALKKEAIKRGIYGGVSNSSVQIDNGDKLIDDV